MGKIRTSLNLLKYADQFTTYHAGDVIFKEGDPGTQMFVVKAGTVELRVGTRAVETLEAGEMMGEMAMLDHEVRSATAIAASDCQLVQIDEERFKYMISQTPFFAVDVMRVMARRLRHMNRQTKLMKSGVFKGIQ